MAPKRNISSSSGRAEILVLPGDGSMAPPAQCRFPHAPDNRERAPVLRERVATCCEKEAHWEARPNSTWCTSPTTAPVAANPPAPLPAAVVDLDYIVAPLLPVHLGLVSKMRSIGGGSGRHNDFPEGLEICCMRPFNLRDLVFVISCFFWCLVEPSPVP